MCRCAAVLVHGVSVSFSVARVIFGSWHRSVGLFGVDMCGLGVYHTVLCFIFNPTRPNWRSVFLKKTFSLVDTDIIGLLRAHLDLWDSWNAFSGNPAFHKVFRSSWFLEVLLNFDFQHLSSYAVTRLKHLCATMKRASKRSDEDRGSDELLKEIWQYFSGQRARWGPLERMMLSRDTFAPCCWWGQRGDGEASAGKETRPAKGNEGWTPLHRAAAGSFHCGAPEFVCCNCSGAFAWNFLWSGCQDARADLSRTNLGRHPCIWLSNSILTRRWSSSCWMLGLTRNPRTILPRRSWTIHFALFVSLWKRHWAEVRRWPRIRKTEMAANASQRRSQWRNVWIYTVMICLEDFLSGL